MQATLQRAPRAPRIRTEVLVVATLFLLPTFSGLIIFHWLPLGAAFQNSLLRFSPLNPNAAVFVGIDNYVNLLTANGSSTPSSTRCSTSSANWRYRSRSGWRWRCC